MGMLEREIVNRVRSAVTCLWVERVPRRGSPAVGRMASMWSGAPGQEIILNFLKKKNIVLSNDV